MRLHPGASSWIGWPSLYRVPAWWSLLRLARDDCPECDGLVDRLRLSRYKTVCSPLASLASLPCLLVALVGVGVIGSHCVISCCVSQW